MGLCTAVVYRDETVCFFGALRYERTVQHAEDNE